MDQACARTESCAGSEVVEQLPPEPLAHRFGMLHGEPEAGLTARARPKTRPERTRADLPELQPSVGYSRAAE